MKKTLLFFILSILSFSIHGQTFLNPSFEINTAGTDQINLSNPAFNAMMANTVAFGSYGDMDIITSTTWCASGHLSNWYVALTGSGTDAFSMRLSAPLVTGNTYTISFWDRSCWSYSPPVEIGLSTVNNAFGTSIYVAPLSTYGVWTQRTFTFVAPNNGQFITVQLTGGGLGDWTHVDDFTFQNVSSGPTANFTASSTNICTGSCINFTDLSTGSPTSWSWTFAGANTTSSTAQNPTNICYSTAGTYAVTLVATNASGSNTLNQTTYITVNPPPTVNAAASGQLTCTNTSVTLTGSSPGSTMVWNGGSLVNASNPATVTAAGTYTVTATSAAGCTNTATVTVTSNTTPPTVTAAASGTITCTNTSVTLTGTSPGSTMVWNGGSLVNAPDPATATAAGTYTVTATDGTNGCTATATVTVTSNTTPPTVTASSSGNLSCTTTSVTLTGTSAGTMVWNGGSLVNAANPATVSAAGTYTVTSTDPSNGCTATATVTVTSSSVLPTVTASTSGTLTCTNNSVTLTGTSTGNNMVWNGGTLVNAANPATVSAAGTYTVTATDPVTGCTNTTTVTVTSNTTPPTVTAVGGTLTCINTSVSLNGTSSGTMVWNGGSLSNAANPATVSAAGTYTVTATDPSNGCTSTATVSVTSNTTPPTVTAASSGTVTCTNPNVTLTGTSAGSTMIWNGGTLVNSPNPATVTAAGTYTVTAVDNTNGCTSTATVTVTSNTTPPTVTLAPADTLTCATSATQLTASSTTIGATYAWSGPGIVSGANSASCVVNAGGTYSCTVTNPANGCTTVQTVTVVANINPPVASASGSATINYGNSTPLTATGGNFYAWTPTSGLSCATCPNPIASPTVTTTYCVAVSDSLGCTDSACVTVVVDIICGEFTFPNAFSPNGDGENDGFHALINPGCITNYSLVVYDRWGEKVFETTDYTEAWDGTYKGQLLDNAVFVYVASATLSTTGEKILKKGNVSLIK